MFVRNITLIDPSIKTAQLVQQRAEYYLRELNNNDPFGLGLGQEDVLTSFSAEQVEAKLAELLICARYSASKQVRLNAGRRLVIYFGMKSPTFELFLRETDELPLNVLLKKYDWLCFPDRLNNRQKGLLALGADLS